METVELALAINELEILREMIANLAAACTDVSLLDLVYKLLSAG